MTIIEESKLKPRWCDHFKRDLIYFFYGRPSYTINSSHYSESQEYGLPVCLVLMPDSLKKFHRVFPFDTGAFKKGYFKAFFGHEMSILKFLLKSTTDCPGKLVGGFYNSNFKYFIEEPNSNKPGKIVDFEIRAYHDLITSRASSKYDDRRSAAEIQSDAVITLTEENVIAVVLPYLLMDVPKIRSRVITDWKAEIIPYQSYNVPIIGYTASIRDKVKDFLEKNNFF